ALQSAAKPVDRPSHHDVELPLIAIPDQSIEGWALIPALRAAYAVILVDPDNFAAHSNGYFPQFAFLIGRGLVNSRNPEIEHRAFLVMALLSFISLPYAKTILSTHPPPTFTTH